MLKVLDAELTMKLNKSTWRVFGHTSFFIIFAAPVLGLCLDLFLGGGALSQTSFYQGKTIIIVESSAPGGVGSMRTKALVPFLQKYIPGKPTIVTQHMDGGGGKKAANYLYNSAKPDGLTIGRMNTPFVMHPILGESGILYDIDKVSYLGTSYSGGYHIFFTRRESALNSLDKLRAASGLKIGSQSVGHLIYISGRMFAYLIGLKQPRFVTGYTSPELDVAIEQGEIDTRSTVADALLHEKPQWVDKAQMDFHSIIEVPKGRKHSHPLFAKLPDVEMFASSAMDRKIVAMYRAFIGSGNPLILPPGTPKDRVRMLQDAMRKTFKDPEFSKDYAKLTGLKAEPQMPEELEQTIKDMPRDREAVELFKKLTGPDPLPQR
jgi:tripartite-type tricarboxylate transporter receptor subunit TctC